MSLLVYLLQCDRTNLAVLVWETLTARLSPCWRWRDNYRAAWMRTIVKIPYTWSWTIYQWTVYSILLNTWLIPETFWTLEQQTCKYSYIRNVYFMICLWSRRRLHEITEDNHIWRKLTVFHYGQAKAPTDRKDAFLELYRWKFEYNNFVVVINSYQKQKQRWPPEMWSICSCLLVQGVQFCILEGK